MHSTLSAWRVAAAAASLAVVPAALAAQGSGSGCTWSPEFSATPSCAAWTITRDLVGGNSNFQIQLTNTTPVTNGPQIFRTIFAYVPSGITEGSVTNFTANPADYTLAGGPFNGEIFRQGVSLGNNQPIIDWTSSPGSALAFNQTGTFTFTLPGTVEITQLGVHAQRVGSNDGSQWVTFPPGGGVGPDVVVPEPGTYALLATGLAALAVAGRRRLRR